MSVWNFLIIPKNIKANSDARTLTASVNVAFFFMKLNYEFKYATFNLDVKS